ncbi:MAG: geranylgeranylglycerol-phosphate geranylgeranyltransferase [Chitinophagaceae bacterium]|nr:geranylgeranylglycerol-phosphate geranylgeranyltransferase [Chitinophagaceae bacterium]
MYCVTLPVFEKAGIKPNISGVKLWLLMFSTICITAAGYVINDYFDLNVDRINKPHKLIVDKIIPRRRVIFYHILLSIIGIGIGFYLEFSAYIYFLGSFCTILTGLLFWYSASLKRRPLVGNVLVSLLAASTILEIVWCEAGNLFRFSGELNTARISRFTFLYAGFAFIVSLIREVIKDMEDVEGDRRDGCKTLPIVWGINSTKIFTAVWIVVLISILLIVQFYVLQYGWWIAASYCVLTIVLPLLWVFRQLFSAQASKDFHLLSSVVKLVMLMGILSLAVIRLNEIG